MAGGDEEEEVNINKKYIFVISGFFLFLIIVLFFFNINSGVIIESSIKNLAFSEGQTISEVMNTAGFYLLKEGEGKLIDFLGKIFVNKKVVYLALIKNGELYYADTKFEGYLPIDDSNKTLKIIDSPSGKIIEVSTIIKSVGKEYRIKIGYLFDSLSIVKKLRNRNIITITFIQIFIIVLIFLLVFHFNNMLRNKEIEIQKEKDEKEKYQEISIMMAGINHEVKNPLNSIYLSFQVLEKHINKNNDEAVFYINSLKSEIRRISKILDGYSDLNRKIEATFGEIDLYKFFEELQILFKGTSQNINLEKHFKIKTINSDSDLLKQIFINLYKNSYEAGANNIKIEISKEKKLIKILFEDDGEGIKEPEKIFIPFYTTKKNNSGLGMIMVKKIVAALSGHIEIRRKSGKGTIFIIYIKESNNE